jgi:hypothetical protein
MSLRGSVFLVVTGSMMLIGFAVLSVVQFSTSGPSGWDGNGSYVVAVEDVPNRRLRHFLQAYVVSGAALSNGVLRDPADDLEPILPAAPEGWVRHDWSVEAGEALTGEIYKATMVSISTTNSVLRAFNKTADDGFGAVAVYDTGGGLVALRLQGDTKALRKAEDGKVLKTKPVKNVVLSIDGVPVGREPKYSHVVAAGQDMAVSYDRFRMEIAGVIEVEVISNADAADVFTVLEALDVAALQASVPVPLASQ